MKNYNFYEGIGFIIGCMACFAIVLGFFKCGIDWSISSEDTKNGIKKSSELHMGPTPTEDKNCKDS